MTPCLTLVVISGGDPPVLLFVLAIVGDTILGTVAMLTGVIHP